MTRKVVVVLAVVWALFTQCAVAQKESSMVGKWKVEYVGEKDSGVYEFKSSGKKVLGYVIEYIDEKGNKSTERELVMKELEFDGKKGEGIYVVDYEGERHEMDCKLKYVNANKLKVSYSYWGYSGEEIWTRMK